MQNRSAIWVFTVLLTLACLYQLSFSWVTSGVEAEAEEKASYKVDSVQQEVNARGEDFVVIEGDTMPAKSDKDWQEVRNIFERNYLDKMGEESVYPLLGYSYNFCKKNELNLGLDLKGGMSVTLEMSVPDLVDNLAGNSNSPEFRVPFQDAVERFNKSEGEDFIGIFKQEYEKANPKGRMSLVFHLGTEEKFSTDMSNDEVVSKLREEAESALETTENILRTRIDKFGVSQPQIQKQSVSERILIELPGVKDKRRVRKLLQATANLEFWETYRAFEVGNPLQNIEADVSRELYGNFRDSVEAELEKKAAGLETAENEKPATEAPTDSSEVIAEANDSTIAIASDSGATDTNTAKVAEETNQFGEGDGGSDIAGDSADVNAVNQLSDDTKRKMYPLTSVLSWNVGQDENGGRFWSQSCIVGYSRIADTAAVNRSLRLPIVQNTLPPGAKLVWSAKPFVDPETGNKTDIMELYALKAASLDQGPVLTGEAIEDASQEFDPNTNQVEVRMVMNQSGASEWERITTDNQDEQVAIVLDNECYSAPSINEPITQGVSSISGNFTVEEGQDLATILKAGSLPARAQIVEESIVGPSLGAENIRSGLLSFMAAFLVILAYMIFYYGRAGAVSDVALFANMFFLVGTLASLQASLTLPGIAGIVLTIGMSVDANVLIYERIREELRAGKGIKLAIADGYKKAYSSIIDANITTLLTAIILATFGSGPIQGFATTLIIGIFTSLFSAIFITRLIFTWMLDKKRAITFSNKITENAFTNVNFGWLDRRKLYYAISGLIVAGGIASLATRGLDYGVDFTGGRTYVVEFKENAADYEKIRNDLGVAFANEDGQPQEPEVKMKDTEYKAQITTNYMISESSTETTQLVEDKLREGLADHGEFEIVESRSVDSQISDEIVYSSIIAIVFSLVIIFLYILFRFRKWQFGLGALLAMFHDVLVVLGLFSIFYGIVPFTMEIDQAFIAAILTVVGYSINDTVVVFDRIREYIGLYKRKDAKEVVNSALNSTLSRTINTSMSTFLVLLIIFLFGGESIRGFTFALMIGVIVGTYSSLCIATPTAFDLSNNLTIGPGKKKK